MCFLDLELAAPPTGFLLFADVFWAAPADFLSHPLQEKMI